MNGIIPAAEKSVIITTADLDFAVNSYVQTCSECCMKYIDGKFNVRGYLNRKLYDNEHGQGCRACPVHLHSKETGEFQRVLNEIDGVS